MDMRDTTPMAGSSSYYMQRGMSELHGHRDIHSNPSLHFPISGPPLVVEPSPAIPNEGINVGSSSVQSAGVSVRRKRGRPRKYGLERTMSLGFSSLSMTTPRSVNSTTQKRGRGRPPGSGRKRPLGSFGGRTSGSAGVGFTPHVITVAAGEDIAAKLMSFAQQGARAVCILSANGAVSSATLLQPSLSSTVTYEGRFDIVCMSGSFLGSDNDGSHGRSGGFSVSLASPNGRVVGGGVGGMLIAATPVQVILGSFICAPPKTGSAEASVADLEHQSEDDETALPSQNRNLNPTAMMGGPWSSPQAMGSRNSHVVDIDLMRG